jgi:HK97 family phage major capsid protein
MSAVLTSRREERDAKFKSYDELRSKYGDKPLGEWETADRNRLDELHDQITTLDTEIFFEERKENLKRTAEGAFVDYGNGGKSDKRNEDLRLWKALGAKTQEQFNRAMAEIRAHQVDILTDGGFLALPAIVQEGIIEDAKREFVVRRLAKNFGIVPRSGSIQNELTSRPSWNWGTELSAPSETNLRFGQRALKPNDMTGLVKISKSLLRENGSVESVVRTEIAYGKAYLEESSFFVGTGTNQSLGLLTPSDLGIPTSQDLETATSGVIGADDLIDLALNEVRPPYYNSPQAAFIMSAEAFADCRKLKDGNGQYIFTPAAGIGDSLAQGASYVLLGKPVFVSEFMPTVTAGNYPVVFGDFRHYGIVDGEDFGVQVLVEKYAENNMNGYLCRAAVDGAPLKGEAFARLKVKA